MSINKILLAAVLGGIAFFLWGWISHGVLPLYNNAFLGFTDEQAVTNAIIANAPQSGTYFLPFMPHRPEGMTQEAYDAAVKKAEDQMANGPFLFASVRVGPMGSYVFAIQLITDILTALFVALVLARTVQGSFKNQVLSVLWVSLAGSCALTLPQWNWYSFGTGLVLADIFDNIVGFLFAGVVIARVLRGKAQTVGTGS